MPSRWSSSSSMRIAPERRRGPASRTKTSRTVSSTLGPAELPAGPHHVLDPAQLSAQAAGGMVEGEVLAARNRASG